jgi:hypothetical protein
MGKKKKYKAISAVIGELNTIMVSKHENHIVKGWEFIARGETTIDGKPVDPMKSYNYPMPIQVAYNHKRKLKKLVNIYGDDIIPVYQQANSK